MARAFNFRSLSHEISKSKSKAPIITLLLISVQLPGIYHSHSHMMGWLVSEKMLLDSADRSHRYLAYPMVVAILCFDCDFVTHQFRHGCLPTHPLGLVHNRD
jgi:hypothetical protein